MVLATMAYLAAGALAGLMHNHHHGLSHSDVAVCDCNHAGHTSPADENDSPTPLTDDDCLACRLAAQSVVVCLPPPELGLCPLVVKSRCAPPIFFVEPFQSCGLARAPPIA
jgi:hypothetical protein